MLANFDPSVVYAGASNLNLSESEMKNIAAPFDDLAYEIRPDGFIYVPQVLTLQRLNSVIGVGKWSILQINNGRDEVRTDVFKVFYDGALVIRGHFVSRSVGESTYSRSNSNQSWAAALEAAKSDCRQRCCKDIGIASDAWNPTFVREWQKKHAIRVKVLDQGREKVIWRRKDVDPFPNEIGPAPDIATTPTVRPTQNPDGLPWLNQGPDYEAALRDLEAGYQTIGSLKASKYRISKSTEAAIITHLTTFWRNRTDEAKDLVELTKIYNENKALVDAHDFIKTVFQQRRTVLIPKPKAAAR